MLFSVPLPTHVVLDFFGTIVTESTKFEREALEAVQRTLGKTLPGENVILESYLNVDRVSMLPQVNDILEYFEDQTYQISEPLPGVLQFIEELKWSGRKVSIVSNNGPRVINQFLFDYGVTGVSVYHRTLDFVTIKPNTYSLRKCLSDVGHQYTPVYFGNSYTDLVTAKNARVPMIAIGKDCQRLVAQGATQGYLDYMPLMS